MRKIYFTLVILGCFIVSSVNAQSYTLLIKGGHVIDPKNNIIGSKITENFGTQSLTYSFTTTVAYANQTVDVCELVGGSDFAKGTYFVNIFDKGTLVSKTSFDLR